MVGTQTNTPEWRASIPARATTRVFSENASLGTAGKAIPARLPNQPPHPPYSDTYILPKTKYGLPVIPDMFADNLINSPTAAPEPKGRWWEAVLATDRLNDQIQNLSTPNSLSEVPHSQRYFPRNEEELIAYEIWTRKARANEAAKAEALRRLFARGKEDKTKQTAYRLKDIDNRIWIEEGVLEELKAQNLVRPTGQEERVKMQCLVTALNREDNLKKELGARMKDRGERDRLSQEYMWKKKTVEYELNVLKEEKARILREQSACESAQTNITQKEAEKRLQIQMKWKKQHKGKRAS